MAALGSVSLAGEGAGDPRVRVIWPPEEAGPAANFYFSGDASVVVAQSFPGIEIQIHVDRGDGWVLKRRLFEISNIGIWPFGLSLDGGVIGITNFMSTDLEIGQGTMTLPRIWEMASGQYALIGQVYGASVSGDGQSVAATGRFDGRVEALFWSESDGLVNLNRERDEPDTGFVPRAMSYDGQVIAGRGERFEPINDTQYAYVNHAWVYFDGTMMDIPELDFDFEVSNEVVGVSGDGLAVIGLAHGHVTGQGFIGDYSWIWTLEDGTVEIADPTRFESVSVIDINYDASIVLGSASFIGGELAGQFLWYPEAGFILLDELFERKGISIDAQYPTFREISEDGTKLMGTGSMDNRSVGLIVTLPEQGDVLSDAQRDGYIRSKLGR